MSPSSRIFVTVTAQRTHRYLRIALFVAVVALAVSVGGDIIVRGGVVLPSLSDYYYSPAGPMFTAALCVVTVALLALSGRDAESTLLDVAAVFVPLIAVIPTGKDGSPSVPAEFLPAVHNGVWTYVVVTTLLVIMGVVLAAAGLVAARRTFIVAATAAGTALAVGVLAFAPPWREQFPFPGGVNLHLVVTIAFFAVFAAVPIVNALPRRREPGEGALGPGYRAIYLAVPSLLVVTLVVTIVIGPRFPDAPVVFAGEATALALFAAYWLAQTVERWDQADPRGIR